MIGSPGWDLLPISKEKSLSYSLFPYEFNTLPRAWSERIYPNLVSYRAHSVGGHIVPLEELELFLADTEEFTQKLSGLFKAD
ncbi:uncharacterized protein BDW43DRAFT_261269 [Aspergillus alliaceus]|uniref:uncharacterized protein n=1 Tax=Petromyces alliaceus TaxID=209559 RepID=UPI0012A5B8D7|nr:uncharacterized protein BDW43DRAFT_261269 [Aspergillus alliaceus]KAB8238315.1 hypothetical protein BDW43DRAFT_261269 [Aspergillus alliaceus]